MINVKIQDVGNINLKKYNMNVFDTEINDEWEELISDRSKKFDRLWREYYSTIPPFDKCPIEFRDSFKEFAWQLYSDNLNRNTIEELLQSAYNLGTNMAIENLTNSIKNKLSGELTDFNESVKDTLSSFTSKVDIIMNELNQID